MNLARFNFELNSMPNTSLKTESSVNGCKRSDGASSQNRLSRDTVALKYKPIDFNKDNGQQIHCIHKLDGL